MLSFIPAHVSSSLDYSVNVCTHSIISSVQLHCGFCKKTFCCQDCRVKHENSFHEQELRDRIKEEYCQSICHMCHGMSLPYNINEKLPEDLMQHIVANHFPLKCNKCLTVFETVEDIGKIGKCCPPKSPEPESKPVETDPVESEKAASKMSLPNVKVAHEEDDVLNPLTKINLHWRRKSMEFSLKSGDDGVKKAKIIRSTSTPVPLPLQNASYDSLQYSSIHYSGSHDDISPPPSNYKPLPMPTPKSVKLSASQGKNRQKLQSQITPLRQIMTKSIQKAIATHGHYKNLNIQQRRMSFDSSTSSNEKTSSVLKMHDSISALDLRTSPALRRDVEESRVAVPQSACTMQTIEEAPPNVVKEFKYQEIKVTVRTCDDGRGSIVTNYESCHSELTTPRTSSNNMLKKTISFESPAVSEQTPAFLMPRRASKRSISESNDANETVYFTPKSTPSRSPLTRHISPSELIVALKDPMPPPPPPPPPSRSLNLWAKWRDMFQKPLIAAAEYILKANGMNETNDESRAPKRRHSNSDDVKHEQQLAAMATSPPTIKRRRIQGRKPIR
jgi:hypothetical protein